VILSFERLNEIKHIGIIGEGKMGKSIFFYLAGFDFRLTWLVSSEDSKEKTRKLFINKTKCLLQGGVITGEESASKIDRTTVTTDPEDLRDCDLVIEAINEDIGMKKALFESLDRTVNTACIFASNSSAILPSQLVPSESRKDRFCGLHFFYPAAIKEVVELITNPSTSSLTKESLHHFLLQINKRPFHQDETNAFLLNRLFLDFQAGAYRVFLEGRLSYKELDELVRLHFFPIGVFEFFDHVGIDVMLSSVKAYTKDKGNQTFYAPLIDKMEELVKLNRLGTKTKQGFYDYMVQAEKVADAAGKPEGISAYKRMVTGLLWDYFIKSVNSAIENGLSSREELAFAIKDYMGMDSDPFNPPFSGSID
jgi:3-hydroxybutyryl-CoA dehydrogenase